MGYRLNTADDDEVLYAHFSAIDADGH